MPAALVLDQVSRHFAKQAYAAVDGLSLTVEQGEIVSIVGESGSGKSTMLRLIAGLEVPDSGEVWIGGECVASESAWVPVEKRQVGMVFQDGALFPHLKVADNIIYGLNRRARRQRGEERARELLDLVGLDGFGDRYPSELSGGERQRIALARALAPQPQLLLLDEPFSNLDPALRRELREQVCSILRSVHASALMVTHDTEDATSISDRIAIVRAGKFEQVAEPSDVLVTPANLYCAELFGPAVDLNGKICRPVELALSFEKGKAGAVQGVLRRMQSVNGRSRATVEVNGAIWFVDADSEMQCEPGDTVWVVASSEGSLDQ